MDFVLLVGDDDGDAWSCRYNLGAIEHRLVDQLESLFTKSQLQDLKCVKCGAIKPDNLAESCDCSGTYECAETPPKAMEDILIVHRRVAEWHKFEWLLEVVSQIEMMSTLTRPKRVPRTTTSEQ